MAARTAVKPKSKAKKAKSRGAAKTKTDGGGSEPKPSQGVSERKREANRRNSRKSTGPRTAAGKRNSRFNAVTHGLTAQSVLLPGEDPVELAARQQQLIDAFQPSHEVELAIVERMAADIWRSDRAERGAGKRIAARLRHEPLEQAAKEQHEALDLGRRLFWQLSFPLPISQRSPDGTLSEPPGPDSTDAIHPHDPARLRLRLEQTVAGSGWLIDRWCELGRRFCSRRILADFRRFKMVRLMGKHAIDMADDLDVVVRVPGTLILGLVPKTGSRARGFRLENRLSTCCSRSTSRTKSGWRPRWPRSASRLHAGWPSCRWPGWLRATKNRPASG